MSSGRQKIDWIYVDDVMDGFLAAARAPNAEDQTIDLGSGALISIRDVVDQLVNLTGFGIEPLYNALPDRLHEPVRVANIADARAILGWKPRTPLAEGLARTVEWHRNKLRESSSSTSAAL